jgi:hypothetical protein
MTVPPRSAKQAFSILVLADLTGQPTKPLPRLNDRRLIKVTRESYPQLIRSIKPHLAGAATAAHKYDVSFDRLDDFYRKAIIARYTPRDIADCILSSELYHRLRATWSGLKWLVDTTAELTNVNVKVLNVAKRDLLKDLQRAPEYDWSVIFRKVYTDGLGTFGGDPVGVIIADQFFCAHPEDIELVEKMVQIASAAFCPFVCGATADFFSVRRWDDPNLFDPAVFREWSAGARWRALFEGPDCKYFAPLLPRWRAGTQAGSDTGTDRQDSMWLHPGYLVAARIARAMNTSDSAEVTANLFPGWQGTGQTAGEACASFLDIERDSGVELERNGDDNLRADLAQIGSNAVSLSGIADGQFARPAENLAGTLLTCHVAQSMYQHARNLRRSNNA